MALAFVLRNPLVSVVLFQTTSAQHLIADTEAISCRLSDKVYAKLLGMGNSAFHWELGMELGKPKLDPVAIARSGG
tara:strand:+ start:895 stop:1122 length:228 start_codon:yes stop_codon:yes gene_type:complete